MNELMYPDRIIYIAIQRFIFVVDSYIGICWVPEFTSFLWLSDHIP
jgi:hypothetical protein